MALKRIGDYAAATLPLVGTEMVEVSLVGSTGSKRVTVQDIANKAPTQNNPTSPVTTLAIASGDVAVNCALGNYFTLAATANMATWTFTGLPAAGRGQTIMIKIQQDATGSRVSTWPASFKWDSGTPGVLSTAANAKDMLALTTFDQGATWDATLSKARA